MRLPLHRRWWRFRMGLLNIGDGPDWAKLQDMENAVLGGVTVLLGAEFGDRQALVGAFLRHEPDWDVIWDAGQNKTREVPILYDTTVWRRSVWHVLRVKIGYLGPQGAGGDNPGLKAITEAGLVPRVLGSRRVWFRATHAVVSAFSTHGAEGNRRKAAWVKQMTAFFAGLHGPTFGGGDLNADYGRWLEQVTPPHWVWDNRKPTRGQRCIDHGGHTKRRWIRCEAEDTVETDGSTRYGDHRLVVLDYAIRLRGVTRRKAA